MYYECNNSRSLRPNIAEYIYCYNKLKLKIDIWKDGDVSAAKHLTNQIKSQHENETLNNIFYKNNDNNKYHNYTTFTQDVLRKTNNNINYKWENIYKNDNPYNINNIKNIIKKNTFKLTCLYKCIHPTSLVCIY